MYSSNSLKNLFSSIGFNLFGRKPPLSLKADEQFKDTRSVLKTMCARSEEMGRGAGVRPVPEKNFSCDQCDHKSASRHNLRYHIRNKHKLKSSNTEIKGEYLCKTCGYKALHSEMLKTHKLYVHSGASFLCDKCDYRNGSPGNVKKHIEREHPDHPLPTNVTMILPNQ